MNAFAGAFYNMGHFMRSDVKIATGAACPWTRAYVDHVAVIVAGIEVRRRMTATVFIGMKNEELKIRKGNPQPDKY